ncbi:MAG: 23S rRNA pseudouridine(2604) synthase RluF [Sphingobacteriales bacterium]|nr:23S rRNA pseudouridine(2604) synthase RluF [Sphingobacteriales bacterium]MBI3720751.1 23S rRNA pseudouridine(2604) synthase RluF [Sphingobacteriales bacterium]
MEKYSVSLNKFIADSGYCSRREADRLIEQGRVFLNNELAQPGNRYTEGDTVEVDGSYITAPKKEKFVYLAFNKPVGITSTTDENIKGNIITFINYPKRIFPIGRLDKDSEGLIFLTNDGDIVNKILRAGNEHEKEYIVRVNKPFDDLFLQKMSTGVPMLGTVTKPCKVFRIGKQVFKITLTEGLNRQIRRMCEHFEYEVESLKRVRIMNIKLDVIPVGKWRYLSDAEMKEINSLVSHSSKTQEVSEKKNVSNNNTAKGKHKFRKH